MKRKCNGECARLLTNEDFSLRQQATKDPICKDCQQRMRKSNFAMKNGFTSSIHRKKEKGGAK